MNPCLGDGVSSVTGGAEPERLRWYFRRKSSASATKLMRARPPIAPPTMAPMLLLEPDGGGTTVDDCVGEVAESKEFEVVAV